MSSGSEKYLEVIAGVSGSIVGSLVFFVAMEPPPKRPRLEHDQYEFVFQSTTPMEDQRLYKPKLLQLIEKEMGKNGGLRRLATAWELGAESR